MNADIVLKSNVIYDGRRRDVFPGGVAITGNRITAVGSAEEIDALIGPETRVLEYEDKLIMPGIIDNHVHVTMGAMIHSNDIDLTGTRSAEECVEMVRDYLARVPDAPMVYAQGWMLNVWDNKKDYPTKQMLDAISTEIPICLGTADGWNFWVNSKALETFGYTKESVDEAQSWYVKKDKDGELTGILYNLGCTPAYFCMLDLDPEEAKPMILSSLEKYNQYGITAAGDVSNEWVIEREPAGFKLYRDLEQAGKLNVRIYVYPSIGKTTDFSKAHELQKQYSDGYVRMLGLKAYQDGVIDSYTGVMVDPYLDDPEQPDRNGEPMFTQEALNEIVTAANADGFPVRIHCTGDGSTRMSLNAFEASIKANGRHGLRNGIEHIEACKPVDRPRFAELEVMANKQPGHFLLCDEDWYIEALGQENWHEIHPFKCLLDAGAPMSLSTDFPIIEINPFSNIYAAVTRRLFDGTPLGDNPEDCLDIYDALYGYTYMGAYGMGLEDSLGSLEAGKLADVAVINGRVVDEAPEELLDRKALLAIMDGKIVYEA